MKHEKFAIWLSGFVDLSMGVAPTKEQWELITEKLAETFDEPAGRATSESMGHATGGMIEKKPEGYGLWGDGNLVAQPAVHKSHISGVGAGVRTMELRPGDITLATVNSAQVTADNALASRISSVASNAMRIETETTSRAR